MTKTIHLQLRFSFFRGYLQTKLKREFFQFGLYLVVAPLSFLPSISLASLFTSLSIFGWSDILQILRRQAAFSFAVVCIISTILSMSNNKSYGFYSCPVSILKHARDIISDAPEAPWYYKWGPRGALTNIFNKSIDLGTFPSKLKITKVI